MVCIRRSRLADKTKRLVGAWPIINWPLLIRTITPECRGNYQRGAGTTRRSPSNKRTRLSRGWLTAGRHRQILTSRLLPSTSPPPHLYTPREKGPSSGWRNRTTRILHVYRNYVILPRPDNRRRVFPLGKIGFASGRRGGGGNGRDDCV